MSCCAENLQSPPDAGLIWKELCLQAEAIIASEPSMQTMIETAILGHTSLESMIASRVATRLASSEMAQDTLTQALLQLLDDMPDFGFSVASDLQAVVDRDPACCRYIEPVLYFKGFLAIQTHRFAHQLWQVERRDLAYHLQSRSSSVFQTDIHPAAKMGKGLFLDHATGLVVGETAVVADEVSIMQDVTLGGTGKLTGDRHPKIRHGVLIGAGAKVLGNIEVGECAKVASCSVVLRSVPAHTTVAGVPAKIIGGIRNNEPALSMDQTLSFGEGI